MTELGEEEQDVHLGNSKAISLVQNLVHQRQALRLNLITRGCARQYCHHASSSLTMPTVSKFLIASSIASQKKQRSVVER
jgi:hypothetical protein